jgi:PAS domain S-box-containing protein
VTAAPLLEDLRRWAAPTWLWDAGRGRVVWANAAGIAAFDCDTLFDLIDHPFDGLEPGIAKIASLGKTLAQGQSEPVTLMFPSTGSQENYTGKAYLHPLADGRPGVLVVIDVPVAMEAAPARADAPDAIDNGSTLLDALPHAAALCDFDLRILKRNTQMLADFPDASIRELADVIGTQSRVERLAQRLQGNSVASSIEPISTAHGQREFRVTLSKLQSNGDGRILLLLEDITERRQLERQLSALADAAPPKPVEASPKFTSAEQVFAEIGRQLTSRLSPETPPEPQAIPTPAITPAIAPTAPAGVAAIPEAVRQALEQSASGIAICQQGKPVYVTQKAVELFGLATRADALANTALWTAFADVKAGKLHIVDAPNGTKLAVTYMPMPWQNGRADQFSFQTLATPAVKKRERTVAVTPVEAATVQPPATVPSVASTLPHPPAPSRNADNALQQELKSILDVVSDGIITLNNDGEILSFSAGAEAIFGARSSEALGRPMTEFLAQDSRKIWRDYLKSLSGPGLGAVFNDGREMNAKHAQGGVLPLFISLSHLQGEHGKATLCAVVRDISPWKKTERELTEAKDKAEQANRRKSEFIAHISHELRTPLNAILGFSDVMRGERLGAFNNPKYLAYANDIHTSGTHLLAIINDLLDLAKVEAGKLELNFTAVGLEEVADYVLRMTREDAASASVIVRRAIPGNLPRVVADLKSLRQVLLNLVSNAIKFTNAGGEILISANLEHNGTLVLRVKDSGVGMSATELEAALQPFGRVEDADRPRPGTGLGLPLTKSLVEANRAQLALHSEPGRGTLAEITFPGPRVLAE